MKQQTIVYNSIILILLIIPLTTAFITTGNTYDSRQTIITSGGTNNITSTNFIQQIALGQAATGLITSASFDNYLGFFFLIEGNQAPSWAEGIPTANVNEDSGWSNHDSDLTASGNGQCVDPNYGDILIFTISSENTGQVDCEINNSVQLIIRPANNWTGTGGCTVRCSDGSYVADYPFNIEVNPINDPPTHTTPILNATSIYNKTGDNLTAYNQTTTDIDGDTVYNIFDFRKDGTSIAILNMAFNTNITSTATGAVKDYTTYKNNGTLGGGTSDNAPTWTSNGRVGGAYDFDGKNDYLESTNNLGLSGDAEFTIEFWAKWKQTTWTTNYPATISMNPGTTNQGVSVTFRQGRPALDFWNNRYRATNALNVNQWYHIAVTKSSGPISSTSKIYVNGTEVTGALENSDLTPSLVNNVVAIGRLDATRWFNGTIDEVKVYNYSLSPEQILASYQAGLSNLPTTIIISNETTEEDNWTVAVTPNDLIVDGETLISNSLIIQNTAPTVTAAVLTSTSGNNLTTDNLTVSITSSDPDNDAITNITDWRINGTSIAQINMPFDTNITSTATSKISDYSTNENNGTLGAGSNPRKPTWHSNCIVGGCYDFDGDDDTILIPHSGGKNITVSMWINRSNTKTIRATKKGGGTGSGQFIMRFLGGNFGVYLGGGTPSPGYHMTSGGTITANNWYMITWTYNSSKLRMFIDGNFLTAVDVNRTTNFSNDAIRLAEYYGVSTEDFNGSIDELFVSNKILSDEQIEQMYQANNNHHHLKTIVSNETSKENNWTVAVTPNDLTADGNTLVSNQIIISDSNPNITLTYPTNNTILTQYSNRTPTFTWTGIDYDKDTLNYTFWIYEDSSLTILNKSINTQNEYYLITNDLDVDKPYWWLVEAFDQNTRVNSTVWNFTIESYKAISLTTSTVDFGSIERDTSADTENNATPLIIENIGNIYLNLTMYANTTLWVKESLNTSYFQYRADIDEVSSYDIPTSQTTWTNMSNTSYNLLKEFNFHEASDSAQIDINITAPEIEPPGSKTSQIVVSAE